MNWQARPQRSGSLEREMPQSVQRLRGSAGAKVVVVRLAKLLDLLKRE